MALACPIRYRIDPFQRDGFGDYARHWTEIIPREERSFVQIVPGSLNRLPHAHAI